MSRTVCPAVVAALTLVVTSNCAGGAPPFDGLDPTPEIHAPDHSPVAVLQARIKASNAHDLAAWEALHTEDCVRTAPELTQPIRGRAGMRAALERLQHAVPDYHVSLIRAVSFGPWVAAELRAYGQMQHWLETADGSHVPPTGKRFAQTWSAFIRLENGRIAEIHEQYDQTDLTDQLMGKTAPKPW